MFGLKNTTMSNDMLSQAPLALLRLQVVVVFLLLGSPQLLQLLLLGLRKEQLVMNVIVKSFSIFMQLVSSISNDKFQMLF